MSDVSKIKIGNVVYNVKDGVARAIESSVTDVTSRVDGVEGDLADIVLQLENIEGGVGITGTYDASTETLTLS